MRETGFETQWGAHLRGDGTAVFRLWAPALESLRLRWGETAETGMERRGDGWFHMETRDLAAGTPYRFVLPDGTSVPDPASRAQLGDVHGPSLLTDSAFEWKTPHWKGRPWEEAVIYELHPGTFSPEGGFDGVRRKLDHLADCGFTAIELMPVAQFSGDRGWGYDGVLPYCPHRAYGGAAALKRLVDAAHERGLMMMLDVVYNHFGPDGNYLHLYAPQFFDEQKDTPWGPAIRMDEPAVRAFFIDNAIYWLDEFRFDGLRLDAIDRIGNGEDIPVLKELAGRVRTQFPDRHIHLTTEDERNIVALHPRDEEGKPLLFTAEWNDDIHHAAHCIATGEDAGYYEAFADDPVGHLARGLTEGFCFQGEAYAPWGGEPRGEPSAGQPPSAFIDFLQNHDQIGNRAFGERLTTLTDPQSLDLLTAVLILNPQIPLFFMGEEFGETRPFLFFTDFHGYLAKAVAQGRRREFKAFSQFAGDAAGRIPDPNALSTFENSRLDWEKMKSEAGNRRQHLFRRLLAIRRERIAPHLAGMRTMRGKAVRAGERAFTVAWQMADARLSLAANFGGEDAEMAARLDGFAAIYESGAMVADAVEDGRIPARSVAVFHRKESGKRGDDGS